MYKFLKCFFLNPILNEVTFICQSEYIFSKKSLFQEGLSYVAALIKSNTIGRTNIIGHRIFNNAHSPTTIELLQCTQRRPMKLAAYESCYITRRFLLKEFCQSS